MEVGIFADKILSNLAFQPTAGQVKLARAWDEYINSSSGNSVFVLKGYAGTGKTSMISALVKSLSGKKFNYLLLAPTGRAAKVISNYAGTQAFTIHKKIYQMQEADGKSHFSLQENKNKNCVFIIDEASMIGEQASDMLKGSLLGDLMTFIESGTNCKAIFVGDTAQLPPIGADYSPALSADYLQSNFGVQVEEIELDEVVRQQQLSGILHNATALRDLIRKNKNDIPSLSTAGFKDIYKMTGEKLEDGLNYAYQKFGVDDTMVICRSNKEATLYNKQIRSRIFWREERLNAGDRIMVVKNNYFWIDKKSSIGFIANGDIAEVLRVKNEREEYGFTFADVRLKLIDYPNEEPIEATVYLETLESNSPALAYEENQKFYQSMLNDLMRDGLTKRKAAAEIKKSPLFNALQIKFAYAVTCHKAQGGQWKNVFVNQGYLSDEMINLEYLRWLYTATTRATAELFLINFHSKFFKNI